MKLITKKQQATDIEKWLESNFSSKDLEKRLKTMSLYIYKGGERE